MRTFYAALALFALLLSATVWNYTFINQTTSRIVQGVSDLELSLDSEKELDELFSYWEERKTLASLSVAYEIIYELEGNLTDLRSAMAENEKSDFENAKARTLISAKQLKRLEQFSFENIF